jgi:hypothetical protein
MSSVPVSLRRYRADLVVAIDRELADARRARPPRALPRPWPRWGALLLATAVVAAAFVVFTTVAPWQSSPTILDRAEAALLAPSAGQILYERVTVHPIVFSPRGTVGRVQLWLDGARPHRFRMTFTGAWQAELGGTLETSNGLNFLASEIHKATFPFRVTQADLDPASFIRTALASGRAEVDGRATIRGRNVIRIQLSAWFTTMKGRVLAPIALYYVDVHTYRPVRVVIPPPNGRVALFVLPDMADPIDFSSTKWHVGWPEDKRASLSLGVPMDPSDFLVGFPEYPSAAIPVIPAEDAPGPKLHRVYDFEDYRLLAPTAANRRLANLRAMHPHADVP